MPFKVHIYWGTCQRTMLERHIHARYAFYITSWLKVNLKDILPITLSFQNGIVAYYGGLAMKGSLFARFWKVPLPTPDSAYLCAPESPEDEEYKSFFPPWVFFAWRWMVVLSGVIFVLILSYRVSIGCCHTFNDMILN